jgi:ABC-type transport system involved in multi-copper enzyme maturation permease subunit
VISGEYSTGMIRSSFMAVPRRLPVLWAKLAIFSAVTFVLMLVSTLVSFLGVQAIVTGHHLQHGLGDPNALRAVVGTALFLTVLAAMAVGFGALLRNTAGGIAAFFGVLFVLPGVVGLLPASISDSINPYLPLNAGTTVATTTFDGTHLGTWTGFAVFCGYAALVVGVAAVRLVRRDA